jgi:hypothetical protein
VIELILESFAHELQCYYQLFRVLRMLISCESLASNQNLLGMLHSKKIKKLSFFLNELDSMRKSKKILYQITSHVILTPNS